MCETMLIRTAEPDFAFNDERGTLTQIVSDGYKQVNCVFTKKGMVRGNMHYHLDTDEAFFVAQGRVKVTACLGDEREEKTFGRGDMFIITRGVRHTFEYLEDTYLVALYTEKVEKDDGTKDIHTD